MRRSYARRVAGRLTTALLLALASSPARRRRLWRLRRRGCTSAKVAQRSPFAYDATQPLAVRDAGRVNSNYPIAVRDVSFASGGRRVQGFLAVPPGQATPAGGSLPPRIGRRPRDSCSFNAVWLAGRGAVTLAITAPSEQAPRAVRALGRAGAAHGNATSPSPTCWPFDGRSTSCVPVGTSTARGSGSSAGAPGRGPGRCSPESSDEFARSCSCPAARHRCPSTRPRRLRTLRDDVRRLLGRGRPVADDLARASRDAAAPGRSPRRDRAARRAERPRERGAERHRRALVRRRPRPEHDRLPGSAGLARPAPRDRRPSGPRRAVTGP